MKKWYFMMIAVFALLCISSVSASDNANLTLYDANDGAGAHPDISSVPVIDNDSGTADTIGTFDDLKDEIQKISSGDTYDFKRNYRFDENNQTIVQNSIINNDNIDTNYLNYSHFVNAWGDINTQESYKVDIIPLIYQSIMKGGINACNNNITYSTSYNDGAKIFFLNLMSSYYDTTESGFHAGIDYVKSFRFTNITDLNQVFDAAIAGRYESELTQVMTLFVSNELDYIRAATCSGSHDPLFMGDGDSKIMNGLKVIFTCPMTIHNHGTWNAKRMGYDTVIIMGNGSTIIGDAGKRDEKKWLVMDSGSPKFLVYNLTIKGFNTAIECLNGLLSLNNVTLDSNCMDYWIDRDWGAAILSTGTIFCDNCTFTNNYAKYGGAIFNQGFLSLNDCIFKGNTAYGYRGDNVCVGDGGLVAVDGVNVIEDTSIVYFAQSISTAKTVWMGIGSTVGSFAIGVLTGMATGNPIAGIAIGTLLDAGLGTMTSSFIISHKFDIHADRVWTCVGLIGGSALAGALGGYVGYWAVTAYSAAAEPAARPAIDSPQWTFDDFLQGKCTPEQWRVQQRTRARLGLPLIY